MTHDATGIQTSSGTLGINQTPMNDTDTLCAGADIPCSNIASRLQQLAQQHWLNKATLLLIGQDPAFEAAQRKLKQVAMLNKPVLITGETGVGKEAFARSLYLLCRRRGKPFLTVNCAQYQGDNLIVSELFGHTKGSFTGATVNHKGLFEEADQGVLFLDEVSELSPQAQAMLLRALGEGEIKPLGSTRTRSVDVRVVAATNRNLEGMVEQGDFRNDLYYRLRYLRVRVPPVRERGNDWQLIANYYLNRLNRQTNFHKRFSEDTLNLLRMYRWPGNVREIQGIVNIGFCMSDDARIEPEHILDDLSLAKKPSQTTRRAEIERFAEACYRRMAEQGESFWNVVHAPFLDRELNRAEVQAIVQVGLRHSGGSYKRALPALGIAESDYLKFMDFLRHHRLKPEK